MDRLQEDGGMDEARYTFNAYKSSFEKQNTTEKQILAISLILAADELITRWIFKDDREMKIADVPDFLRTKESVSVNARAYDFMREYVASNFNKFLGHSDMVEVWGDADPNFVYVIRNKFNQICDEGGYNAQAFLSWMKQNGLIETSGKGMTKTKRINGESVHCVWMRKPQTVFEDAPDDEEVPFVKK